LAGKEYGASDHANKKSTGYDEHDQANRIGRRLEASYLSVQEFLVSAIHMHLDPASLPVRTISPSICSAISESDRYPNIDVVVTSSSLPPELPGDAKFMPEPWRPLDVLREVQRTISTH
jgi:hypothetical protein